MRRYQISKEERISSMHINGLVDPATLVHSQDRRIISMGRHDLMTMPLIGWFSRRWDHNQ